MRSEPLGTIEEATSKSSDSSSPPEVRVTKQRSSKPTKKSVASLNETTSDKKRAYRPALTLTSNIHDKSEGERLNQEKKSRRRSEPPKRSPREYLPDQIFQGQDNLVRAISSTAITSKTKRKNSGSAPLRFMASDDRLVKERERRASIEANDSLKHSKTKANLNNPDIFSTMMWQVDEPKTGLWDRIFKPADYSGKFLIPMGSLEMKKFLEKKISDMELSRNYSNSIKDFEQNNHKLPTDMDGHSVNQVLHAFPELLDSLDNIDDCIIQNETERLLVEQIKKATMSFAGLRDKLLDSISNNNQSSERNKLYWSSVLCQSAKYFSPENSHHVLNLIGDVKHQYLISQSIYFVSSAVDFVIGQYREEIATDIVRLQSIYDDVERILRRFIAEGVLASPDSGEYRHSTDIQSISFICMNVWKQTLQDLYPDEPLEKAFQKIHSVKVIELSLNMFIALSRYFLDQRLDDPDFNFYNTLPDYENKKLNELIIKEFSALMKNNLSSKGSSALASFYAFFGVRSMESRGFQSVTAATFRHMIAFCNKANELEQEDDLSSSDHVENDRLKQLYRQKIEKELANHCFIIDKAFSEISYIDEKAMPKRFKHIELPQDQQLLEKDKALKLSEIMKKASTAIASGAGLKTAGLEIKLATFFRYLATSSITYLLNTVILKRVCSDKTLMLMYLPAYKLIDSQVKRLIDMYDQKVKKEQEKYNETYRIFNSNILRLFELNYVKFKLSEVDGTGQIDGISVDDRFKLYARIMSESLDAALQSKSQKGKVEFTVEDISEQDFAAISMVTFNLLSFYMLQEAQKTCVYKIDKPMIKRMSETIGPEIARHLELNQRTGKYSLRDSPQTLFDSLMSVVKNGMGRVRAEYEDKAPIKKLRAAVHVISLLNKSRHNSHSTSSSSSEDLGL